MVHNNKINKHLTGKGMKAFVSLLLIITGFCNASYGQEQNDTTINYNEELDEVTVVARHTAIQKNGDIVVNIQNNPIAEGKSTIEMLNYIKGVNARNNSISIFGREGTILYLDNRVTTINELMSISPDMIAKVIVSPHAATRYGTNATGGVIHVILKKKWGLMGALNVRNQYNRDGFVDVFPLNSMLYRTGKHSIYNSLTVAYGNYNTSDESTYLRGNDTDNYYSRKKRRELPFYDNIGYIYNFTDDDYVNIYGGAGFSHVRTDYQSNGDNKNLEIYNMDNNTSYSGGIEYKKFFNDKYRNSFTVNATYNGYTTNLGQTYMLGMEDRSESRQHLNSYTIIPEISLNIKGQQTLNAGIAMYMLSDNNYYDGINNSLLDQVVKRDYSLSGLAVRPWVEYSKTLGQRLYMRIGLEYYNGGNKHKDHIDAANNYNTTDKGFYPNVLFQWWPDKNFKSCMSFSYRHYYSLPDYGYYSPVAVYTSDNMYSVGNIRLTQETFDSFEMNYYLGNNWVFTYRTILGHDIIRIISHYDSSKEMFYTMPDNVGSSSAHRISAAWNGYIIKNKWYSNNALSYNFGKEEMPGTSVSRPYMYFSSSNQYKISDNAGITMELYAISKTENLNYEKDWIYFVEPGMFVTLFKKKLSLNLTAANLIHNQFGKIKVKGNGYEINRTAKTHVTRLVLTAIWNFKVGKDIKDVKKNSIDKYKKTIPVL